MLLSIFLFIIATSIIWIPGLLIYLFLRNRNEPDATPSVVNLNDDRDREWTNYISSFQAVATSKKEQALLAALLSGASSESYADGAKAAATPAAIPAQQAVRQSVVTPTPTVEQPAREPMDNTLLLLYFGAFLLVASVGLFVALGGLPGIARTVIVGITAAILYLGGLKLYDGNQKLAAAGISFVGSGMIIAPLTGVAWFNLVADKQFGGLIWLVTSLACISLYVNAYRRIKSDFTAYLLIGSFISTVESSVLTLDLPGYAYAWGLAVVGIVLLFSSRNKQPSILDRSSSASASLLIPLSILGSFLLLPEFGNVQLAVTLLLAGVYYGLLGSQVSAERREFRMTAQVMVLAALANIVYVFEPSFVAVGISLLVVALGYILAMVTASAEAQKDNGLMEIACTVVAVALLCSVTSAWALVAGLAVAGLLAAVIWLQRHSDEALQILGVISLALPFVIGLYALRLELASLEQLYLAAAGLAVVTAITLATVRLEGQKPFYHTAVILFWTGLVAVLLPASLIGSGQMLAVVAVAVAVCLLFRKLSGDADWLLGTSIVVLVPASYAIFSTGFDSRLFSLTVLGALAWNIGVSLLTREGIVRWIVVLLILTAPVALGGGGLGFEWGSYGYSVGYILAMLSCILARAIARGKLLVSFKVPIASYYASASQAYIFGYITAGLIALGLSLNTEDSRLLTTLLLAVVALVTVLIAKVERNAEIYALLPILLQLIIFSALRPDTADGAQLGITAVISVLAAALSYGLALMLSADKLSVASQATRQVSLFAAYVGPALALANPDASLLLPVSLFIAGLLTVHFNYTTSQQNRELSLAVCFAAVHWLLFMLGVENIHVHTHILAVFLAAFAGWRYSRGERTAYDSYVRAIFFVITVPLILSSLYDEAGSVYGLILIGEQVLFMLAGATLPTDTTGHRFLLRWGLWTALAAILFQLRGLGWAFLSLLAIIVIAVAVYRLQKTPPGK